MNTNEYKTARMKNKVVIYRATRSNDEQMI